jgi:hypothetical protein
MYEFVPESGRVAMTREQIREKYDGKWLFIIRVSEDPYSVIPVVVADAPMEGSESGIYKRLQAEARAERRVTSCISLLPGSAGMSGFEIY